MAETFKAVNVALGSSADAVVYTCPGSTTAIVIHCQVANVDGTNAADVTVSVTKANFTPDGVSNFDTSGTFHLAKTVSVPADATLVVLDTPIYMMESDVLKGGANASGDLELFVSYESIDDA